MHHSVLPPAVTRRHLHNETKLLPVKEHNKMLSQQYLISCHQETHPCNSIVNAALPPRNLRKTVRNHDEEIASLLSSNMVNTNIKSVYKEIHTKVVEETTNNYIPNKVLNTKPPEISPNEKKLPRETRTTLTQLRSGWSKKLNHYMNRLDPRIEDKCNICSGSPHDTLHLFNCPTNPTQLTPLDLWLKPGEVAEFLGLPTAEGDGVT